MAARQGSTAEVVRDGFLVAVGLSLAWLCLRIGAAGALADTRPELALRLEPHDTAALVAQAEARLKAKQPVEAALFARRALARDPLSVEALRELGLADDAQGKATQAQAVIGLAGRLSWRDSRAHVWLLEHRMFAGDLNGGFAEADSLLRRLPNSVVQQRLLAVLVAAARFPQATPGLVARLEAQPPWRGAYMAMLGAAPGDSAGPQALMTALAQTPAPPTAQEIAPFITRLVSQGAYGQALNLWRTLSPSGRGQVGLVRDGGFAGAADGTPFTWNPGEQVGASTQVDLSPDRNGEKALRVDYDGVSTPALPRQLLVLPPGDYQVTGDRRAGSDEADGRMLWSVVCSSDSRRLGQTDARASTAWQGFQMKFSVPPSGCPAQWLSLEAQPGERRDDVVLWFSRLAVTPARN